MKPGAQLSCKSLISVVMYLQAVFSQIKHYFEEIMQQNQEGLIVNKIVISYHEFQRVMGKLINIEYVANLQSCPKFLGNLERILCYLLRTHLKKRFIFFICWLTLLIQLLICKKLIL